MKTLPIWPGLIIGVALLVASGVGAGTDWPQWRGPTRDGHVSGQTPALTALPKDLKPADGKTVWQTSFEKDFGVKFLGSKASEGTSTRRGNNGSGVIDGTRLILPVGSTQGASLVGFDKFTGQVLWKSGNDEAAYSSFMVGTIAGL